MDFIIHELLKEPNGKVEERFRDSLIKPSEKEEDFVSNVTKLFRRHQAGRVYGNFVADTTSFPFSRLLKDAIDSGDFYAFSRSSAQHLSTIMGAIPAATGGYYFAARFNSDRDGEDTEDTVLVFMLSQRTGHAVNKKTLTLESVLNLEMEHLDLAAHVNLTDWMNGRAEPVSLIRGRKEVSEYFKRFIGLHEPRTNTEGTKKLKNFIDAWMEEYEYRPAEREDVRSKVLEYAKKRGTDAVDLKVIAAFVDPDRPVKFFEKANAVGLGAEFHLDRRSLAAWERAVYQDEDIKLSLAKRQFNKRFIYNPKKKTLLINDIVFSEEDLK